MAIHWAIISEWLAANEALVYSLAGASFLMFLLSLIVVPWLIVRIPADYFSHDRKERMALMVANPMVRSLLKCLRNVLGFIFLLVGILLCFIPGQGLLTILVGLFLMNFPKKEVLLRRVVSQPLILKSINGLRHKAGRASLVV